MLLSNASMGFQTYSSIFTSPALMAYFVASYVVLTPTLAIQVLIVGCDGILALKASE